MFTSACCVEVDALFEHFRHRIRGKGHTFLQNTLVVVDKCDVWLNEPAGKCSSGLWSQKTLQKPQAFSSNMHQPRFEKCQNMSKHVMSIIFQACLNH